MQEISEETDLDVQLIEEKEGKKIVAVQFRVRRKTGDLLEDAIRLSPEIAEHVTRLGLSLGDITTLVKRGLSESLLKIGLMKLEARIARDDLEPIGSRHAYLNSVIAEAEKFVTKAPEHAAPVSKAESVVQAPAAQQLPLVQATFKDKRRAEIRAEFSKLSKEKQQPFAIGAVESLKTSGLFNPSIARAIYSGDWQKNGLLLSKMVDAYALATHGEDWHLDSDQKPDGASSAERAD